MPGSSSGFAVRISAVDDATRTLSRINRQLAAIGAPIRRMNAGMARSAEVSRVGLRTMGRSLREVARFSGEAVTSITRLSPALASLTGAATVAGVGDLAKKWADFGSHLDFSASRIGIAGSQLQRMQNISRLAGGSARE